MNVVVNTRIHPFVVDDDVVAVNLDDRMERLGINLWRRRLRMDVDWQVPEGIHVQPAIFVGVSLVEWKKTSLMLRNGSCEVRLGLDRGRYVDREVWCLFPS
jgi:hypothetical protein